MKIAIVAAGFTPAEADELRRSLATFKAKGMVTKCREKLITGMRERGFTVEFAQRVCNRLDGFGWVGFDGVVGGYGVGVGGLVGGQSL